MNNNLLKEFVPYRSPNHSLNKLNSFEWLGNTDNKDEMVIENRGNKLVREFKRRTINPKSDSEIKEEYLQTDLFEEVMIEKVIDDKGYLIEEARSIYVIKKK
jgi:hypothetical protein